MKLARTSLAPDSVACTGVQSRMSADREHTQVLGGWLGRCILDDHSASHCNSSPQSISLPCQPQAPQSELGMAPELMHIGCHIQRAQHWLSIKTSVLSYSSCAMNELSNLRGHSPPFCHPIQKIRGYIQSVVLPPLRKIILASHVQGFERFSNLTDFLFGAGLP